MTDEPAPALDPATFDLDAWLDGVQRLRAVKTLYARRDLMPRIDEIVDELGPLKDKLDASNERASDSSIADAGADAARAEQLKTELKSLWGSYEASGVDFELEQLPSDDYDAVIDAVEATHPEPAFDAPEIEQARVATLRNQLAAREILKRSVKAAGPHGKPRAPIDVTDEMLSKLSSRFGIDQFGELIGQARALTLEGRVDAPFSRRVSSILGESTST